MNNADFKLPRTVYIGGSGKIKRLAIGGAFPVSIQTMWKDSIVSLNAETLYEIQMRVEELQALGCDVLRFAVPDMESAESLLRIADLVSMPLVADIHFDYKLALRCLDGNIAKIRINPGNIGARDHVLSVVEKARDHGVPIRIGVNSGSLPRDLAQKVVSGILGRSDALVETAAREVACLSELGFEDVIVSMKASGVRDTIEANEIFARRFDYPLHIGVTEAGPLISGVVKSTIALSHLLEEKVGSTVRVSLSAPLENEVMSAREILRETGIRLGGVQLISCPRCGRNGFDVHGFVARWQNELFALKKDITIAVMGCIVNGPGEGKHADIGITGTGNTVIIFRKGEIVRKVPISDADVAFREELEKL